MMKAAPTDRPFTVPLLLTCATAGSVDTHWNGAASGMIALRESNAWAEYTSSCPTATTLSFGEIWTLAAFGRTTWTMPIVVRLPELAVMITRPFAMPCTKPVALTVARVASELVQFTADAVIGLSFSSTSNAVSCTSS